MADKKNTTGKSDAPDLETAMQALETLVLKMESGELTLEGSLAAFEEGISLSRQCQQALENAEQKVRILMEKSTTAPLTDFQESKAGKPAKQSGTDSASTPSAKPGKSQEDDFDNEIPF